MPESKDDGRKDLVRGSSSRHDNRCEPGVDRLSLDRPKSPYVSVLSGGGPVEEGSTLKVVDGELRHRRREEYRKYSGRGHGDGKCLSRMGPFGKVRWGFVRVRDQTKGPPKECREGIAD